ncbi:hypothetical protein OS493_015146 [Desmophyllum pertusum]|uniref:Uncharacterized protein n=1 Tax=Desmophyllum pertusum TaxID=174260 RepID=A0A9W9ZPK4_9CNID|nr:hypothetical protein OS493_015146 [Desmophyllum pertusum]
MLYLISSMNNNHARKVKIKSGQNEKKLQRSVANSHSTELCSLVYHVILSNQSGLLMRPQTIQKLSLILILSFSQTTLSVNSPFFRSSPHDSFVLSQIKICVS